MAAVEEDVRVVGLSILSGAHMSLTTKTIAALRESGGEDILVVVGGTIPQSDVARLLEAGAAAVFPTGASIEELVRGMRELTADA